MCFGATDSFIITEEIRPKTMFTLPPAFEGETVHVAVWGAAWSIWINKFSENKEEAYKFLCFLTDEYAAECSDIKINIDPASPMGGWAPYKPWYEAPDFLEEYPYMYGPREAALGRAPVAFYQTVATLEVGEILYEQISYCLMGTKTPEEAMDDAYDELDELCIRLGYHD